MRMSAVCYEVDNNYCGQCTEDSTSIDNFCMKSLTLGAGTMTFYCLDMPLQLNLTGVPVTRQSACQTMGGSLGPS